ncbi:hypothetical protein H1R17_09605 [Flavobacterium sp. xlx-214]|uniref:hypothetical protein n=1 Tax=unclassified Flavobacterium TaxID=196869 RepID=UPI0013D6C386|nr:MULTISPECIES: hypothetical protein [unclassified Flavobacterium]MBA5793507.1 hypothetical protein [Flavobacterium sp. xlx-221]QMI82723.1 hypothetical protein H1R17_09605 [Flavobacterium sp. xlx-214]
MKKTYVLDNRGLKLFISVVGSLYIVFHGRNVNLLHSLQDPNFYIAFTVSFLEALLLVNVIDYIHHWLDKKYDWAQESLKRSIAQFTFGVVFPLMIDFILISVYFYFLNTNIFDSGFLRHDFPVIVLFVVVINMYYILTSLFAEKEV